MKKVGIFKQEIIDLLGLNIEAGTAIYVGDQNIKHMKQRHPEVFDLYFPRIEEILDDPDYVGWDNKNQSVDYVKLYLVANEYIQVSVRISATNVQYARTLFLLMTYKAQRYIDQGTLIPVPKK